MKCIVRKFSVADTPEERVRQHLLSYMIDKLKYPPGYLSVEVPLKDIPHLSEKKCELPDRRVDIICYAKGIHPKHSIFPLLVIECKAIPLTEDATRQLLGYHHYIRSPFFCVANQEVIKMGYLEDGKPYFLDYLPDFNSLLSTLRLHSAL